jgi:hypothetical protein
MAVVGRKEAGVPASVKVWLIGVPIVAPPESRSVATTVPLPEATEVEKAHAVGVSMPVRRTAGWGVPLESVTTTLVLANGNPVGDAMLAPLVMATTTAIREVLMELVLFSENSVNAKLIPKI